MALPRSASPTSQAWLACAALALLGLSACAQSGANRRAVIRCTPGERVDVSCGCLGIGTACDGRAGIRLCDALLDQGGCEDEQAVTITTQNELCSSEGSCPLATTFCPSSGLLAISTFSLPDYAGAVSTYSCQWGVRRSPVYRTASTTFACAPGELVRASCGCQGMGRRCDGDPIMRACAPGAACTDTATSLDYNDDTCDRCPLVEATCPTSGSIVIDTAPLSGGSRYRCDVGAFGSATGVLTATGGV